MAKWLKSDQVIKSERKYSVCVRGRSRIKEKKNNREKGKIRWKFFPEENVIFHLYLWFCNSLIHFLLWKSTITFIRNHLWVIICYNLTRNLIDSPQHFDSILLCNIAFAIEENLLLRCPPPKNFKHSIYIRYDT